MARPEGFEPPAFWFVARRSIQLSYGRTDVLNLFSKVYSRFDFFFNFDSRDIRDN